MRKSLLLVLFLVIAAGVSQRAQSQTLQNVSFKLYVSDLNDTITLHIGKDSSWVTQSGGMVVVRSVFSVSKDTVTMKDYDGQYACPGQPGVYTYTLKDDVLTFFVVGDACEGRRGTIGGAKWIRQH